MSYDGINPDCKLAFPIAKQKTIAAWKLQLFWFFILMKPSKIYPVCKSRTREFYITKWKNFDSAKENVWVEIFLHPDYIIYLTFSVANNTLYMTVMYTDIQYYYRKTTRARHRHTRYYYYRYMVIY